MADHTVGAPASHSWVIAVNVRGDALSPAVMGGEILIVETDHPKPDDQVRLQLDDGSILCKRLLLDRPDGLAFSDLEAGHV